MQSVEDAHSFSSNVCLSEDDSNLDLADFTPQQIVASMQTCTSKPPSIFEMPLLERNAVLTLTDLLRIGTGRRRLSDDVAAERILRQRAK